MLKLSRVFQLLLFCSFSACFYAHAQKYDPDFYLSDKLNLEELHPDDLRNLDSCLTVFHNSKEDTSKYEALYYITEVVWDDFVWPVYNEICYEFTVEKLKTLSKSSTREYHYFKDLLASTINNKGYQVLNEGDYKKALHYFYQSLDIFREIGSQWGMGSTLNNIANVHDKNGDFDSALEYYNQSLAVSIPSKDHGTTLSCYVNMGSLYQDHDISIALQFYKKAIRHLDETGSVPGDKAQVYNNIANLYQESQKLDKARNYFKLAYEDVRLSGHLQGLANIRINMADLEFEEKNFKKADSIARIAVETSEELGFPEEIMASHHILYQIHEHNHDFKNALFSYKRFIHMRDSLSNRRNVRIALDQKYQYEYNLKLAADSLRDLERDKLIALEKKAKDAEIEQHKAENEKTKNQQVFLLIGLLLVAILGVFIFNRLRISRRQNSIISKQKVEVESQKQQIENQHENLREIHKEISDSINYAKRLQSAILPSFQSLKSCFEDAYVLYQPKDVVSGDFYWSYEIDDVVLFAVADCTGHGVPGAMVSVVCSNALNRSVKEFGLRKPNEILDKTRDLVIDTFTLRDEEVKDGMDISLIAVKEGKLQYAGANNALWIIRQNNNAGDSEGSIPTDKTDSDLIELKPNKQPIGLYENMKKFDLKEMELQEGDQIVMFSDGYIDQFGGPKGKKFKSKNLKVAMLKLSDKPLEDQGKTLTSLFEEWKGNFEQLDDVCVAIIKPKL